MTKRKKLAKEALGHPELHTFGELAFFRRWLDEHKKAKVRRKNEKLKESVADKTVYSSAEEATIDPLPAATVMTTTEDETGRMNIFAKEPEMYIDSNEDHTVTHNEKAEKLNGRLAMLGVIAAIGAYALTGQLIPGVW